VILVRYAKKIKLPNIDRQNCPINTRKDKLLHYPDVKKNVTLLLEKNVNSTYMRPHRAQIVFDILPPEETESNAN